MTSTRPSAARVPRSAMSACRIQSVQRAPAYGCRVLQPGIPGAADRRDCVHPHSTRDATSGAMPGADRPSCTQATASRASRRTQSARRAAYGAWFVPAGDAPTVRRTISNDLNKLARAGSSATWRRAVKVCAYGCRNRTVAVATLRVRRLAGICGWHSSCPVVEQNGGQCALTAHLECRKTMCVNHTQSVGEPGRDSKIGVWGRHFPVLARAAGASSHD